MIRLYATITGFDDLAQSFRDAAEQLPGRLEDATRAVSELLEEALRADAPVGKPNPGSDRSPGALRDSITFDLDGATSMFFASEVAWYVIGGTRPHEIQGSPTLHFYWDKKGGWVTFAKVQHPGTKPNDFRAAPMTQAGQDAEDELNAIADWLAETV